LNHHSSIFKKTLGKAFVTMQNVLGLSGVHVYWQFTWRRMSGYQKRHATRKHHDVYQLLPINEVVHFYGKKNAYFYIHFKKYADKAKHVY